VIYSPRSFALTLATVGLLLGAMAALRLGAIVSATPASLWLDPYPRLVDPASPVDNATRSRAEFLAGVLGDASLMRSAIDLCIRGAHAAAGPDESESVRCLSVIDQALRSMPSSGELWLAKARLLLVDGQDGEPVFDALRNSYRVSAREGWIAGGRVVLGLRIFPLLPPDLQERVKNDFRLVMTHPSLSAALVGAYAVDPGLRQTAAPALLELPAEEVRAFAELVHDRIEPAPGS
jgi:hypothetical protein